MLYEKGLYTDSVIHIFGRSFRVHRVSTSSYEYNSINKFGSIRIKS